jgi:hypothetical protein
MTTTSSDVAPNVKPKKKRPIMPTMFKGQVLHAGEDLIDDVLEGVGGKDYLAALFANGVLGKRTSKKGGPEVERTTHKGEGKYSDRKYRIIKNGGEYEVKRMKG